MSERTICNDSLRAMNGDVHILGVNIPMSDLTNAMDRASAQAENWDRLFSRFVADSTLCRLNAADGSWMVVDEVFLNVLSFAVDAARSSSGLFDPSILPALEYAGYDRSFELIGERSRAPVAAPACPVSRWSDIEIDRAISAVRLPRGMRVDLGGIAKGAYADELAKHLRDWPGGYVEAGGDLVLWGLPPTGDEWIVGIEDPFEPSNDITTLTIAGAAAVATSGTNHRRWTIDDELRHHLIDPRTGIPVSTSIISVTTVASTAVRAEVGAKELLIRGASRVIGLPYECTQATIVDDRRNVQIINREVRHVAAS